MPTDLRTTVFHLAAYVFLIAVLIHGHRRGARSGLPRAWFPMEVSTAFVFGYLLEWSGVHVLGYYNYGSHALSVDGVPLSAAAGWGAIIYAAMRTTDVLGLPQRLRPFADSFFAVLMDLGLDSLACRVGYWNWTYYPADVRWERDWFGVPFGNFYGWIFIVLFFSLFMRLFRARATRSERPMRWLFAAPLPTIVATEVLVFLALELGKVMLVVRVPEGVIAAYPWVLVAVPTAIGLSRCRPTARLDWPCWWIPAFYHLYSYGLLLFTPLPHVTTGLMVASTGVLLFATGLHAWLVRLTLRP